MKRKPTRSPTQYFAVVIPLMLLSAGVSHAAESVEPPRGAVTVTTSLITPFFGAYEAEAKLRVSNAFGLVLNASYLTLENHDWKTRTGTVVAGVNYFFDGDARRRWYLEAISELMLSSWRHQPSGEVAPVTPGYTGIASVGYRFVCKRGPVVDVGAGVVVLHFLSAHVENNGAATSSEAFTKVYPGVKLNVGWAF